MQNQRLATEWLLFVGSIFFGILVGFPAVFFIFGGEGFFEAYMRFLKDLLGVGESQDTMVSWLFTLLPYLLLQFIRSVLWAIKTVRS